MRTLITFLVAALLPCLVGCMDTDPENRKAVPPPKENSDIPWNSQGTLGGTGGFGMLPGSKTRR